VVFFILFFITFPETSSTVVGNGSVPPLLWNMSLLGYLRTRKIEHDDALSRTASRQDKKAQQAALAKKRKLRWPNPLKTVHIIMEKDVGMLLLYNSLVYTAFYDMIASLPELHTFWGPLRARLQVLWNFDGQELRARSQKGWLLNRHQTRGRPAEFPN
jgi:hypothetical protein